MKRIILPVLVLIAVTASGCGLLFGNKPISANIAQDIAAQAPKGGSLDIVVGLQEAAYNFDGAISVGITDKRIAEASACVHGVLQQLGADTGQTPAPTFVPKTTTLIGRGSVAFIRFVQVAGVQGSGIQVPSGCTQQIGQIVLDAAAAGASGLPGGGNLIKFK